MLTKLTHKTTLWGKYNDHPDYYRWLLPYKDLKGVCCYGKEMWLGLSPCVWTSAKAHDFRKARKIGLWLFL